MPSADWIPTEYLRAIGEVNVRWNDLDGLINVFLICLLGKSIYEERSHIVFAHMAFPQKLDVLGALVEEVINRRGYSKLKKYKATVLPLLKNAQKGRNLVIHSDWTMRGGEVVRTSVSARGSFKFSSTIATLEEIEAVIQLIEKARSEMFALVKPDWAKATSRLKRSRKEGKT